MLFVFIVAIILGAVIYMFESGKNPAMTSIPTAIYWAIVTITTVGYGDISPVTPMGQFISTIVMLLGYSIIAVPTGIVVGETMHEYRNGEKRSGANVAVPEEFNEYESRSTSPSGSGVDNAVEGDDKVRVCPHCGHVEEEPGARFCRYCGTLLNKSHPRGWINDFFSGERLRREE